MSDTLEESLPAHAPLGPSSAEGWSTCSDYVNANRGLPDWTTEPAAEGTTAHHVSELCLSLGLDADDFLAMVTELEGFTFAWEEDDAMLLQIGIDRLRAAADMESFFGERRVDISAWTLPGQFGTLDRAYIVYDAVNDEWWIVIEDLKWGRGIAVSPVENKQLVLYALGFWQAVARRVIPAGAVPRFRLMIDQPRHAGGGGVWETTLDDLLARGAWLKERAALTALPNPSRTASLKGCMWCRRKRVFPDGRYGGCNTYDEYMIGLLGLTWADIDIALWADTGIGLPMPIEMTAERASFILTHEDAIKRWLAEMREKLLADAVAGADTGEVKAVLGNKSADTWKEKGATAIPVVLEHIGPAGFTKKLKSPKQMLSLAGDDEDALAALVDHIQLGRKQPVLVSVADARPAFTSAQSQFDEEDEDDD